MAIFQQLIFKNILYHQNWSVLSVAEEKGVSIWNFYIQIFHMLRQTEKVLSAAVKVGVNFESDTDIFVHLFWGYK